MKSIKFLASKIPRVFRANKIIPYTSYSIFPTFYSKPTIKKNFFYNPLIKHTFTSFTHLTPTYTQTNHYSFWFGKKDEKIEEDEDTEELKENEEVKPSFTTKPVHVAVILDGNRRFADEVLNSHAWEGHEKGSKVVRELLDWVEDPVYFNINQLTLYTFSIENFSRSYQERTGIFRLFNRQLDELIRDKTDLDEKDLRLRFIGRTKMFDEYDKRLRRKMEYLEEYSKDFKLRCVNFCVAYGGQSEIVDSMKKVLQRVKDKDISDDELDEFINVFDEEKFSEYLSLSESPDIIIRTGGRKRVSNFLLYQNAYSEWFFLDKFWPQFTKQDLIDIVAEFKTRNRTFGQ